MWISVVFLKEGNDGGETQGTLGPGQFRAVELPLRTSCSHPEHFQFRLICLFSCEKASQVPLEFALVW